MLLLINMSYIIKQFLFLQKRMLKKVNKGKA